MTRKKISSKKAKYIKILDKASVVASAVALTLGVVQKMVKTKPGKTAK